MKFSRVWGMPSADTFDCHPIADFVWRYLKNAKVSVDPFARNRDWCTHTNDLNPQCTAQHHLDAQAFLELLALQEVRANVVLFDPPYSNEQLSRSYTDAGFIPTKETTQNGALFSRVRNAIAKICAPRAVVLSFGWNSAEMGQRHGFEIEEIMLCAHGGAHNDTICVAERLPEDLL